MQDSCLTLLITWYNLIYKLLRKDEPWPWKSNQQSAFQQIKETMTEDVMLAHFAELVISCDASFFGVGAVL